MTLSVGEVTALLAKAATGAGAPPAQAAAFGRAGAAYLLAGQDAAKLTAVLEDLPGGAILELPLALARAAEGIRVTVEDTQAPPGLLAAYLETSPMVARLTAKGEITLDATCPSAVRLAGRISLDPAVGAAWSALAARGLVPESDQSRRSGAGAGLTDND